MPGFSERKSRRIGIARRWANEVGSATFSTRFGRPFSLMTSPSAWSMRSNDFDTTGRMWRPASVSTSCCGRRSNSVTPRKFSSTITCRLTALWATVRLLAAAVNSDADPPLRTRAVRSAATICDPSSIIPEGDAGRQPSRLIARARVRRDDMAGASRSQEAARHCARLVHIRIAPAARLTIPPSPRCLSRSGRRADRFASPHAARRTQSSPATRPGAGRREAPAGEAVGCCVAGKSTG